MTRDVYTSINDESKPAFRLSDLAILLYYGLCRDASWTYAAEDGQSGSQQVLTSFLGTLAGLVLLILAQSLAKSIWGSEKSIKEIVVTTTKRSSVPIAATTLVVPAWNGMVGLATAQLLQNGVSESEAGYYAGLFPGFVEGPLQQMTIIVGNLAKAQEREVLRHNPRRYLLNLGKDMLLSFAPGAIPGNIWKLVYNACKINNVKPLLAVVSVSGSVGFSKF